MTAQLIVIAVGLVLGGIAGLIYVIGRRRGYRDGLRTGMAKTNAHEYREGYVTGRANTYDEIARARGE